ncbi:MAG: arsenate reductase ArsC [Burkholderiales bacterium]
MTTNVLILCTHNSARSVLGEAMVNHWSRRLDKDVRAFSAGSTPSGKINPIALEVLGAAGIDTVGLESKSWDTFARDNAPRMRVVITVCDNAAAEACPYWPGAPVSVHWGYPDPSDAVDGPAGKRQTFEMTRQAIGYRGLQLLALPLDRLSDAALSEALMTIATS